MRALSPCELLYVECTEVLLLRERNQFCHVTLRYFSDERRRNNSQRSQNCIVRRSETLRVLLLCWVRQVVTEYIKGRQNNY